MNQPETLFIQNKIMEFGFEKNRVNLHWKVFSFFTKDIYEPRIFALMEFGYENKIKQKNWEPKMEATFAVTLFGFSSFEIFSLEFEKNVEDPCLKQSLRRVGIFI